jgi:indole-3-acetate monooxygenase
MATATIAANDPTRTPTAELLERVERIAPIIRQHAADAEANRRLATAVWAAMEDASLFAMLAPRVHGGWELPPVDAMPVWEAIARIDPSAAWNLLMTQGAAALVAWLPEAGAREVMRDGPTTRPGWGCRPSRWTATSRRSIRPPGSRPCSG